MREHRDHAAQVDGLASLVDLPFYAAEAGIPFSSSEEAGRHFLSVGRAQDLSPSPFFLWAWIAAQGPAPADVWAFAADPSRACAHPAFAPEAYLDLCRVVAGDVATLVALLSRIEVDHGLLLPCFADAARLQGRRDLRAFLASLTTRDRSGPGLEMPHFSSAWYLDAYDDVAQGGANPFRHYVVSGWKEGRDPSPSFSTVTYLDRHPDVARSGVNPLIHYLARGEGEGRSAARSAAHPGLVRHATKRGRLPASYVPFESQDDADIHRFCADLVGVRLIVVVPFFENEGLVEVVCPGLEASAAELAEQHACVLLVNDSPGHDPLRAALRRWAQRLSAAGIDVVVFEAQRNGGFIRSTNIGLRCADLLSCPCLMLNSDARLQPGSLSEMLHVMALDDRFAFVNPLSNNATIATLGLDVAPDASAAAAQHGAVAAALPRFLIVPTCVGFCLLVRPEVIKLFGYLDPVYGHGYSEENDYIMRANRKGFVSVLAPRAFVTHIGEQSFSATPSGASSRDARNRVVLLERYPEFETAVERYFASPEAQVRRVVESYARSVDVMIDASTLPVIANGTSVLAREMIPRLVRRLGVDRCAVRASADHLRRLGLAEIPDLRRWDPDDRHCAKVSLRLSQPYSRDDVEALSSRGAKVVVFMLDTISDDCLYLQDPRVRALWEWVAEHSDAMIYNSPYSMAKYQRRFQIHPDVIQRASYHSLDIDEYRRRQAGADGDAAVIRGPYLLIVGNHYQHKAVGMAIDATEDIDVPRVLVGVELDKPNLTSFESGQLGQDEIALLFRDASAILFPSLYEGFGFPLMEGLATGKPVVTYGSELTRDMLRRLDGPSNVLLFETFAEIGAMVRLALTMGERPADRTRRKGDGWQRSIDEVVDVLAAVQHRPLDYVRIVRRQRALSTLV